MFALRGVAISLTFFVLLYCLLSAMVTASWRLTGLLKVRQQTLAALLFVLRVLPLAAAVAITLAFVVPSFQLLEPRSANEGIGEMPPALGMCALLFIVWGCVRVIAAHSSTSRVVARWLEGARPLDTNSQTVTLLSGLESPPLTLVGVRKPKVLVSESTVEVLTPDELRVALQHELSHVRSHDNLKKLIFRFCPFPGMAKLESAWSQAAEMAADDAAVSKLDDAVDLAAALVKLSRLLPVQAPPVCTVGFVTGSLSTRVARLLAWHESDKVQPARIRPLYSVPPLLAVLLCVVTYGPVLALTHEATEWLVR